MLLLFLLSMAQDENCPLNIGGICYEMVAHGFSEKQLRDQGRMKPCEVEELNSVKTGRYLYCVGWGSFQTAHQDPGTISPNCCEAIRNAKYYDTIDGRIVDLKSLELLTAQYQK